VPRVAVAADGRSVASFAQRGSIYNASKFGQVGFVRALDIELRSRGVRCSNICPDDVADVVMFALTRPRSMRLMTTTFRPMSEGSWG